MNVRLIGFTLLCILVVAGLIAGLFAQSIERAFTLPSVQKMPGSASVMMPTIPAITPAATQVSASILAQDTFQRANQTLWGAASDGQAWGGDANTLAVFSITAATGQISQGQSTYNAVLGPVSENVDVVVSGSLNHFAPTVNFGAVLRWTNANNWYEAFIDGSNLVVLKAVNGVHTRIRAIPFTALDGKMYTLRFRAVGATLFARVWQSGDPEPNHWMVTVSDTSLTSGQGGVRIVLQNNTIVHVISFLETVAGSGI